MSKAMPERGRTSSEADETSASSLPGGPSPEKLPAASGQPTVFVIDNDSAMRESLVESIGRLGFRALGFAEAGRFHRFYRANDPGCLVVDVHLPGRSGLELYEQLLREGKRLPVIFITAHPDVPTAVAAMKTGAIEFLEKPFDRTRLQALLEKALAIDAEWRRRDAEFRRLDERVAGLTRTDRETLQFLVSGHPNKKIAATLMITERAVELRRSRLMQKLGAHTLAELLDLTITHRVLDELRRARDGVPFARQGP